MKAKLVVLRSYLSRMEAEIAKGFLEANNITAILEADDAGGMFPFPVAYVSGVVLKFLKKI